MTSVTVGPQLCSAEDLEGLRRKALESGLSDEQYQQAFFRGMSRYLDELDRPPLRLAGLGQGIPEAPPIVVEIQRSLSPWLWIFSVLGFGMALANRRQIASMYGSWKRAKAAHA